MDNKLSRRSFLSFALIGGFISMLFNKLRIDKKKEAMFWRKKDDA